MRRGAIAGPVILLVVVTGFYWKLLTKQYTWLDHPDLAFQVLPWYQFQAASWHNGEFPLWDPHDWGGQPLIGQLQPGAAYPPNWLLLGLPLKNGHVQQLWLHLYFIITHYLAALFAYWLCVDLKLERGSAILGGLAFALGGVTGKLGWPQMLNGAIWIPLAVLFCLRSIRGRRPVASAALSGTFAGFSLLSGHHQIPTFTLLLITAFWLYEIWRNRTGAIKPIVVFVAFTFLTGALQILPAYEYAVRAIRWVGLPYAIYWGQSVPYTVLEQYSLPPIGILGLVLPHLTTCDTFMGIVIFILALAGVCFCLRTIEVRLLASAFIGSVLFALGGISVFHGAAYLFVPMVEKARTPAMALVIAQFAMAVLAAYGLDALRRQANLGRWWVVSLTVAGAVVWPVLAFGSAFRAESSSEYERLAVFGIVALALAAILRSQISQQLRPTAMSILLIGLMLFELGTVTTDNYRNRDHPGGYLSELGKNEDVVTFLKAQPDFVRLELDPASVPANLGDWYGIDVMQAYLGGMTANVAQFEMEPVQDGRLAQKLFSLTHYLGTKPIRMGQQQMFRGESGLIVYRNPDALPRVWTVHQAMTAGRKDLVGRLLNADPRQTVFLTDMLPALDVCSGDEVRVAERRNKLLVIDASMACRGMVVMSETFFPGWQAKVDGRATQVYEADGALRGVIVSAGRHRIELQYRPMSVYLGGLLTALGLVAAGVIALSKPRGPAVPAHSRIT